MSELGKSELGKIVSEIATGIADVLKTGSTNAASGTPASILNIEEAIRAFESAATFDWKGAAAALKANDWQKNYATLEEFASLLGFFVPEAAVIANDMKLLAPLWPVIVYVVQHNKPLEPGASGAAPEGNGNVSD